MQRRNFRWGGGGSTDDVVVVVIGTESISLIYIYRMWIKRDEETLDSKAAVVVRKVLNNPVTSHSNALANNLLLSPSAH